MNEVVLPTEYVQVMANEEHEPLEQVPAPVEDGFEYRSASSLIFDSAAAVGAVGGGLGALALGAAAVKQTFGGDATPAEPSQPPTQQPSTDSALD